jgi:hypothetical protein
MNEPFRRLRGSRAGHSGRAQVLLAASAVAAMGVITVTAVLPSPARPSQAVTLAVRLKNGTWPPGGTRPEGTLPEGTRPGAAKVRGGGRYFAEIRRTEHLARTATASHAQHYTLYRRFTEAQINADPRLRVTTLRG